MDKDQRILELEKQLSEQKDRLSSLSIENETYKLSLSQSEKLHNTIVQNSLDGTIIIDEDYNISYANSEIQNFFDYSEDELLDKSFTEIIHSDYKESFDKIIAQIKSNKFGNKRFEIDGLNRKGEIINLLGTGTSSKESGSCDFILQLLDITDIKAAERRQKEINIELEEKVGQRTAQLKSTMSDLESEIQMRKATEIDLINAKEEVQSAFDKEKELNSLKTRFISMISHEYRTPLTVILTSSYLIEQFYQGTREEEFKKYLVKIRTSVNGMTQLLEDVLAIGKSESDRSRLNLSDFDVIDLINDLLEEIQVVDKNKHKLELSYSIIESTMHSDMNALKHILQNLLTNACKYSPEADQVDIDVSEIDDKIQISVKDYGIGIPLEDQKQLFSTFHRSSNVGTIQGTGLGLSILKKSVDMLKGDIQIDSAENEGTKFTITIPKNIAKLFK